MEIDLLRLINSSCKYIDVDFDYSFSKEELEGSPITKLDNIIAKGIISKDALNNLILDINVKGIAVVLSSVSLIPTDIDINININDNIEELMENVDFNQKSLDILPIIWENILVEIPIRVDNPSDKLLKQGEGWKVITEEEENKVNPELAKLKDLL